MSFYLTFLFFFSTVFITSDFYAKPLFEKKNKLPDLEVNAGVLYNDDYKQVIFGFKNPFNFPLKIEKVERLAESGYAFSPDNYYSQFIPANRTFQFEFEKACHNGKWDKRSGKFSDCFEAKFSNVKGQQFSCLMTINYELIRNQTFLEQVEMDSIFLPLNDTIKTVIRIKNTGDAPVIVTKFEEGAGVSVNYVPPFTIKGRKTIDLPVSLHASGAYGYFRKQLRITTTEPIESPKFVAFINGTVIGEPQPRIVFDSLVINRGKVPYAGDGLFTFWFTNTGEAPLIISMVKSSCGCLVPNYSREPILPGERGKVEGKYNTRRIGLINKSMTVYTNASDRPIILRIKGFVENEDKKTYPNN